MRKNMTNQEPSYSKHFDALVALTTYLAITSSEDLDAANSFRLAEQLGLNTQEVEFVLDNFKGLFRKSLKKYQTTDFGIQHNYTLQLRYARRIYIDGSIANLGQALSNEELFSLLEFILGKVKEEQENERQNSSNRITMVGAILAAILSFGTLLVTILK
jgi:hypothetical protein